MSGFARTYHAPRTAANGRRRQWAFTLFELLVVVLVLGMLTACLWPALANSGDQATRTVCLNNLRQLGTAMKMYASDNRDYLPYPNWGTMIQGWLFSTVNSDIPDPTLSNNPTAAYSTGLWFPYVKNPRVYLCPVDIESPYYRQRENKLSSYVMNGAVCGYTETYRSCKITDPWSPGCFLLWEPDETTIGAFAFNDAFSYPTATEGLGRIHTANGAQVLRASGEVQFVTAQKFTSEQVGSGKTLAWWSPYSTTGH